MGRWIVKKSSRVDDQVALFSISGADLALVETRRFRDDEVPKLFAVPAHMLSPATLRNKGLDSVDCQDASAPSSNQDES